MKGETLYIKENFYLVLLVMVLMVPSRKKNTFYTNTSFPRRNRRFSYRVYNHAARYDLKEVVVSDELSDLEGFPVFHIVR